jgi:hypothetical protein
LPDFSHEPREWRKPSRGFFVFGAISVAPARQKKPQRQVRVSEISKSTSKVNSFAALKVVGLTPGGFGAYNRRFYAFSAGSCSF